jgi:hypothetical protein
MNFAREKHCWLMLNGFKLLVQTSNMSCHQGQKKVKRGDSHSCRDQILRSFLIEAQREGSSFSREANGLEEDVWR